MQIKYSREDLKKLIKNYYLEKEGRNVDVNITASKECVGLFETLACVTTIKIKEETTLLGIKTTKTETITQRDLENILRGLLEEAGYVLDSLSYDEGLDSYCTGYGMSECTENRAYFKGIELYISKNTLVKKMERK